MNRGVLSFAAILATTSCGELGRRSADSPVISPNQVVDFRLLYAQNCAGCHGKLDQAAPPMSKKFYPHIPQMLPPGKGVTDDPVGVTHWVVKNGIRFSAMPSFEGTLTDDQLWQVSQFLRNADKLPPPVQDALHQAPAH